MQGQIIKIVSNQYTIITEDKQELQVVAMGKLRLGQKPVVGDIVEYDIILKLACSHTTSFQEIFQDIQPLHANNASFTVFSGLS